MKFEGKVNVRGDLWGRDQSDYNRRGDGGGAERTNLTMAKIPFRGMEQKRTNITVGGGVNWMNEVNERFPNEMRDYANLLNRSTKEEEKRREQSNHTR